MKPVKGENFDASLPLLQRIAELEAEVERLKGLDEALHENCTLAEGHPTLQLLDELKAQVKALRADNTALSRAVDRLQTKLLKEIER